MSLQGRRILLTGAGGGIGTALAERLAAQGAALALVGRRRDTLQPLAEQLDGAAAVHVLEADLAQPEAAPAVVAEARRALGGLDVLINLAGMQHFGWYTDLPPEHVERCIDLNLVTPMRLAHAALPGMLAEGRGHVVNVGSIFGSIGFPGFSAYAASKFGLRGFSETLRRELADSPVRVSYIAPRATRTAFNDGRIAAMNRTLKVSSDPAAQVADRILAVLLKGPGERYLGWPERLFVRINAVLPRLVDRDLAAKLPLIRRYAAPDAKETSNA